MRCRREALRPPEAEPLEREPLEAESRDAEPFDEVRDTTGPEVPAVTPPMAPRAWATTGADPALADPPPAVAWDDPERVDTGGTEGWGSGGGETVGTVTEGTVTVGAGGTDTEGVETVGTETGGTAFWTPSEA